LRVLAQKVGVVTLLMVGVMAAVWAQAPAAQSAPVPQWQTDAGGKIAFDVASVKQNKSSNPPHANFPLDAGDAYSTSTL